MGERRDLRELLKDADFTQKRIIDDLASSDSDADPGQRGVARDIRKSEGGDFIKNVFIGVLLVAIVVGSFWVSFLIGKKVLVPPVKNLQTFDVGTPKAISMNDIEKATPVQGEPIIQEKEVKEVQVKAGLPKSVAPQKLAAAKKTASALKAAKSRSAIKTPIAKMKGAKHYKVIVGTYKTPAEANVLVATLKQKGFKSYVKTLSGLYRVQGGAFDSKAKASPLVVKLKKKGFTPTVIVE
jgi:cell division septation protein DedD